MRYTDDVDHVVLAWAVTVQKVQGLSLDKAVLILGVMSGITVRPMLL